MARVCFVAGFLSRGKRDKHLISGGAKMGPGNLSDKPTEALRMRTEMPVH